MQPRENCGAKSKLYALFVCLALAQIAANAALAQAPGVWETAGPFKDIEINELLAEPTNPSILYLGTLGQGVFFTTNGGIIWTQANAPMHDKTVFTLLAVDATLYAGTVRHGVFRSIDGGQNWTQANPPLNDKIVTTLISVDAVALDDSSVMEWTRDELGHLMMRTPELGPSMLRVMAAKLYDADSRIESLAIDQIAQRLVKVLLRLGDQFGAPNGQAMIHIMPLTHELLARYVGTSREIITQHMSQLRRKGVLEYSRSGIDFNPDELRKVL